MSQYQFGQKLKETILGTKMAGFKQPIYEILAFNLQSFQSTIPYELLKQVQQSDC
jgi:hypothetical protein